MCGIIGLINNMEPVDLEAFNRLRDTLEHRGPDDAGSKLLGQERVALGHRRLSFLDLSKEGRQPMSNEDESIWLSFNGEIYNYVEIRKELETKGHVFRSGADSEVLIHGFEEWGKELLSRIKGMFAFAIWDNQKKRLFLARDHFGVKPLYYSIPGNGHPVKIIFASELKAIVAHQDIQPSIDYSAVCDYFSYRYVPSPKTIWQGINKLPPAHYLYWEEGKEPEVNAYWELKPGTEKLSEKEVIEKVDNFLSGSIARHMRSDVPIGSFLSGGYDSSALVYYLHKLGFTPNTFSIGFENWDDSEHQYAKQVADTFNVPNYNTIVGSEQLKLVEHLMHFYDEPIADISIIPTYLVSKLARSKNKAVLSGEGADELFCGYTWQKDIAGFSKYQSWWAAVKQPFNSQPNNFFVEKYAEAMAMGRYTTSNLPELLHPDLHQYIPGNSEWFYKDLYKSSLSPLKAFQYMDVKAFMGELVLVKIDRASMANSLEVRVPFLDHELYEFVYNLDQRIYYKEGVTKFLLRENIKNHLPANILNRPKRGFVGPDKYYMDIAWYSESLKGGLLIQQHIIKEAALEKLIKEKKHWRLWKLFVLEMWFRNWMN